MILSSFRSDHSPGAVELVAKCEGRGGPLNALFIVKAANHHQALVGLLTESLDAIAFWHAEFNEDQAKAASLHARVKALLDVLKP
jgi:hypothetical protein